MICAGLYRKLIKALTHLTIILSITACGSHKQDAMDEMTPIYTAPKIVPLNTDQGYIINPVTGDSIQPIINSMGDTIITGMPVPAKGEIMDPNSLAKPKIVPAGKPKVVPIRQKKHKIPETLTIIPVNKAQLKTFTPGVDTSSFVLINSLGDTVPTGVPIPTKGKLVSCKQPQQVNASPPIIKDYASMNIKYLDVEQGMNLTQVTSILEDSRGNIWIGTQARGVSMYDGETFAHFTENEGLSGNWVTFINEDSQGNLWFGTSDGGVSMYNGESFIHYSEKEGLGNHSVSSIVQDSRGNLWIGTGGGGVCKFNGETFELFTTKEGLSDNIISPILEDSQGNLWFGTWGGGVSIYDGNTFTHLTREQGLINDWVWSMLEDSNGNIWIGTDDGISMYDGDCLTHFTENEGLCNNHIRSMLEDSRGNLWFGTHGGVSIYNGEFFTDFTQNEGLSGNRVRSIMEDKCGNLWFGTEGGGVSIFFGEDFTYFTQKDGLSEIMIMSMLEDYHGNLWFGTWGGGVNCYDGENFRHYTQKEGLISNVISSILEDSHGNIWFGSNRGVCMYDGKTFTHFTKNEGFIDNYINSMLEDSRGNLWFGTGKGLCWYDGKTFTHFPHNEGLHDNNISSIFEDSKGNVWFGGYYGVSKYDGETFTHYTQKEGLSANVIRYIQEDSYGNLWFGTWSGGVSIFNGEAFMYITLEEGLSDNCVQSIVKDSNNDIWIAATWGLNRIVLEPENDSCITKSLYPYKPLIYSYDLQNGLKGISFVTNSALSDSKNRIWWGTDRGLTMLDLNHLKTSIKPPVMQLNRIDINGKFVDYRNLVDSDKIKMKFKGVPKFYNYPLKLELPYMSNHLTFHFSAIDWSSLKRIIYSYKMEGLDKQWSRLTTDASAEYRNMPYGRYTFKVRAIGAAQKWSEPFEYSFKILPPLWFKWWAYMIYAFILLLLVRWYRGFLIKREKINADLRIKEVEVNKMQELDHMKSRFFANISHEFRTPLTLIKGPIEELQRQSIGRQEGSMRLFQTVKRNIKRLQDLINQLLEISKLEAGKVKLEVSEGNLEQFVCNIILSFLSLAESKKIKYTYDLPGTSDIVFYDRDKLEKILTNLISNAFKFTHDGGKIRVRLKFSWVTGDKTPGYVSIEVADTGRGIIREKIDRIFDRFYQVSDSDSREAEGTGLGLALTKELVDLYRGEIIVESEEGKGSTFTVKLPVSQNLFTEEEIIIRPAIQEIKPEQVEPFNDQKQLEVIDFEEGHIQKTVEKKPVILIVEDNVDLGNYISRNLEDNYHIDTAIDGKKGLDKAIEFIPDLIISDVMMPEMDGMEMSKKLKNDERTNHIPIILLTAKADRESKLEGLETGADDYVVKPFDQEELQVRVKNLLEQRERLREKFRKEFTSDLIGEKASSGDEFIKKVHEIMHDHIDEPDYTIEQLAGELYLSRSQLFRKVSALTSYSPIELFRNLRLKKAAILFNGGHKNVTQVMYQVGFNNPSYFAKCFTELFGMNPSRYIKRLGI